MSSHPSEVLFLEAEASLGQDPAIAGAVDFLRAGMAVRPLDRQVLDHLLRLAWLSGRTSGIHARLEDLKPSPSS